MKRHGSVLAHALVGGCLVGAFALANQPADRERGGGGGGAGGAGEQPGAFELPEAHPLAGFDPSNMGEAMADYMRLNQAGKQHAFLAEHLAGEWDVAARFWMGGPDGPPMDSKGRLSAKAILGGRFIEGTYSGEMMGQPFQGKSYTGYDAFTKQFTQLWLDSMSTGITTANGSMSMDGTALTLFSNMNEPMTGEIGKPVRYMYEFDGTDKYVFTAWEVSYGEPFKVMEMTYTRRK
ncbi:MAG: DUF1579 domain-containing protein [Phycisphaerales bacterium]